MNSRRLLALTVSLLIFLIAGCDSNPGGPKAPAIVPGVIKPVSSPATPGVLPVRKGRSPKSRTPVSVSAPASSAD